MFGRFAEGANSFGWQRALVIYTYLKYDILNPGSLGQEVEHREARVWPDGRHGHPVTTRGAAADVVREARQVFYESVHAPFIETSHMNPLGN